MSNLKRSFIIIICGFLCIAVAVAITGYNFYTDAMAGKQSKEALEEIIVEIQDNQQKTENQNITPDYLINPKMDMPKIEVNHNYYIGYLEIPALGLKLPVLDELSYYNLNIAPCRYKGTAYLDNMVIAAHNFQSHFGNISQLSIGDEIIFTDIDGNVFLYEVADFESLRGTQVEDMTNSDYELTLFTCNYDGSLRVTMRCTRVPRTQFGQTASSD